MLYLVICMLIGNLTTWNKSKNMTEMIVSGGLGLLVGGVIWLGFIGNLVGAFLPQKDVLIGEKELCELVDYNNGQGKYIVITIDEGTSVYHYLIETEMGRTPRSVSYEQAYITEGDYDKAVVQIYRKKLKYNWYYLIASDTYKNKYEVFLLPEGAILGN